MSESRAKALLDWVDRRFPLTELYDQHLKQYYTPKNLNFWYIFGSLALTVLAIQLAIAGNDYANLWPRAVKSAQDTQSSLLPMKSHCLKR